VELTAEQGRVLGALVEKERTTPQGYPLTDNALLAACNQTTSRDPVVSYDVATVRMAVRSLREQGLLRTVHRTGERSDKHRHELEQALGLSPGQAGAARRAAPARPADARRARARCERMHPFATLEQVDQELLAMAERDEPLVMLLPRQPGRKEARFGSCSPPAPGRPRRMRSRRSSRGRRRPRTPSPRSCSAWSATPVPRPWSRWRPSSPSWQTRWPSCGGRSTT
jgi:uncharacterized protein YceH (UPF0502 family)